MQAEFITVSLAKTKGKKITEKKFIVENFALLCQSNELSIIKDQLFILKNKHCIWQMNYQMH